MSAIRRNDRRANRNNLSSPYVRPSKSTRVLPPRNSLWSLSGLVNFLNPFRGNDEPGDSDVSGSSDGEIEQGPPPRRFSPPQQPLPPLPPPPPPPPQQPSYNPSGPSATNGPTAASGHVTQSPHSPFSLNTPSPGPSSSSLARNLEPVARFLVEKAGQPLNEFEAAGIVDYIQKNVQGSAFVPEKPEPFRFSASPSRSASPNQTHGGISSIQTPRKTLSRNPNGVYRWQGAGSSRPRNRYQSPGFTPRPQQHRIRLSPPKTPPTTDTKRRRVDEEAEPSTPQKTAVPSTTGFPGSMPDFPIPPPHHATGPSVTFLNGRASASTFAPASPATPSRTNGIQPRIRTGGLPMKPTTPAIPSPLRQTWKESDSPPQPSPPSRPTRAADFMTELIKEVTPTKKPDVSNPYQNASPVKPPAPVRKPVAKRPKPVVKPAEKPTEQKPEMSAQTIIEATIPKGTKRSRPPPGMEKPTHREEVSDSEPFASAPNGSAHTNRSHPNVVETITISEGDESPSKRRKTPPARPSPRAQETDAASALKAAICPAEIVEPADDTAPINDKLAPPAAATTLSSPSVTKPLLNSVKTSAPKEPSKLRYSFHADKVEVKSADSASAPTFAPFFVPEPVPSPAIPKITGTSTKAKLSPKEQVLAMDVDELPKYTFSVGTTSSYPVGPGVSAARIAVLSLAVTSLPTYEFTPFIAPARAMNGFNWTAAGMTAPIASAQTWACSLCGLQNPADAKEKCTVCDSPRPVTTSSPSSFPAPAPAPISFTPTATASSAAPLKSFDWSAAGITRPSKPESDTWICSVCMLSNPASAADKCSVCDAPR